MTPRRILACILSASALAAAGFSFADDTAPEESAWKVRKLNLMVGEGFGKKNMGRVISGEYMFTTGPDRAGNMAMTCMSGSFMVVAATKDISIDENFREAWMYPKKVKRQPTVTINGEQQESNSWIYIKKRGIAIPQSRKLSRQIYNAVIRGDKVNVDFDSKRNFELNLPKANDDFAYFGAECGMGKNK